MIKVPTVPEAAGSPLAVRLLVSALVVGLLTGLIGGAFRQSLEWAQQGWQGIVAAAPDSGLPGWLVAALLSAAGVGFAAWLTHRFAPETAGSGVPEIEGALSGQRPMRWKRVLPVKFVGGIAAIGSGMILGREGPTIQMGGALGKMLSDKLKLNSLDTNALIAAGAGAGLATAFNAPFAGILFVLEEMRPQFRHNFFSLHAVIIAAVAADIVVRLLLGGSPIIMMNSDPMPALPALWLFLALGLLFGLIGPVFNYLITFLLNVFSKLQRPLSIALAVGAIIGFLTWLNPSLTGGSDAVISQALSGKFAASMLLLLFLARFVGGGICFASGVPGGIFAPMLTLGTLLGVWFGNQAASCFPALVTHPEAFAVAGMGALFAATVRAPLTGIALTLSMTANYQLVLPLLVTCLSASLMSHALGGRPIYTMLLLRTLAIPSASRDTNIMTKKNIPQ